MLGDIKINQRPRWKCFSDLFLQWLFFDSLSDTDTNFKFQFSFDAQMHDRKYGQRQRKRRHMNVNYLIKVINSVIKTRPIKDGLITLLLTLEEYFYYWLWKFFGVFSVNYEQVLNCNVKIFFFATFRGKKKTWNVVTHEKFKWSVRSHFWVTFSISFVSFWFRRRYWIHNSVIILIYQPP